MDWDDWPRFEQAACRAPGTQVAWWFPERGRRDEWDRAKKICAGCPHQLPCAEFGIAHPELQGIWGGLSHRERKQARRQRLTVSPGDSRRVLVLTPPVVDDGGIEDDTAATGTETEHRSMLQTNGHSPEVRYCQADGCTNPIPQRRALANGKTCSDACGVAHTKHRRLAADARRRSVAQNGVTAPTVAQVPRNGAGMNGSPSNGVVAAAEARAFAGAEPITTSNWLASGFQAIAYVLEAGELLPVYTRSR